MVLPSTSVTLAPSPWSITAGTWMSRGSATTRAFRRRIAADLGPGILVTILIVPAIGPDLLGVGRQGPEPTG